MEQRLSLVTLGVTDLERSVTFYAQLGWTAGNDWREQDVAFFQCGGMVLALWDREQLARDGGTAVAAPGAATLALNVSSQSEVDAILAEAVAAGARLARAGAVTSWGGYSGVFHDVDGHPWEIAHNPGWRLASDGSTTLQ